MPRIRTIKPSFFRSEDVSVLPLRARLTWIGLWTQCDDQGRTKDNPKLVKGDIWPLDDVSLRDIEDDLATLAAHGRIVRYEVDGAHYLAVVNWHDHQSINKPTASKIPPPAKGSGPTAELPRAGAAESRRTTVIHRHSGTPTGNLPDGDGSTPAGKGKERKGKEGTRASPGGLPEQEPPTKCEEHQHLATPPPCGHCAEARKANDRWHTARRQRIDGAPKCRLHRGQPADNCAPCRSEQLAERT